MSAEGVQVRARPMMLTTWRRVGPLRRCKLIDAVGVTVPRWGSKSIELELDAICKPALAGKATVLMACAPLVQTALAPGAQLQSVALPVCSR